MALKKISWFSLALFVSLFLTFSAKAQNISFPYAESGNWWDAARPGEGLVLERQGNLVGMILFTYSASGQPEFYLATGPITTGPFPGTPVPLGANFHYVNGTLYRFKNGPVFNSSRSYFESDPPANEADPVGQINAHTDPFSRTLQVRIILDEDRVPPGSERMSMRTYRKSTFGYGGFGRFVDDTSPPYQSSRACWVDLRGRWVFVDRSDDASRTVWSFNFTELETSPAPQHMTCPARSDAFLADHVLRYRDAGTGATLRCVTKSVIPWDDPGYQPNDHRCVLRTVDDEPLLWFSVHDVGAKQIIGTLGEPPGYPMIFRGFMDERVTGLRVD